MRIEAHSSPPPLAPTAPSTQELNKLQADSWLRRRTRTSALTESEFADGATHTHTHRHTHTQQFSVTDNDSLARNTSHLAMALQAECLSRFAQLRACEELDWETAEAKGRKATEMSEVLPSQLPRLLQNRRQPLQAQAHVALGCALLSLQKERTPNLNTC